MIAFYEVVFFLFLSFEPKILLGIIVYSYGIGRSNKLLRPEIDNMMDLHLFLLPWLCLLRLYKKIEVEKQNIDI